MLNVAKINKIIQSLNLKKSSKLYNVTFMCKELECELSFNRMIRRYELPKLRNKMLSGYNSKLESSQAQSVCSEQTLNYKTNSFLCTASLH